MHKHRFILAILLMLITAIPLSAGNNSVTVQNKFKQFFNNTAVKVKEAQSPQEKREILNNAFERMENTLSKIAALKDISESDKEAVGSIIAKLKDKHDELNGINGYQRVADSQLDKYADYVQQDAEQADQWVTISVTTLLLVAILLILLVR